MSNKKLFRSTAVLTVLTTAFLTSIFHDKAEAINVDQNYRGKVCIYAPKAWVIQNGTVQIEVYWGEHTMRTYVNAQQFPGGTNWSIQPQDVGWSGTYNTNPNFGVELNAYGNNVTNINTNFPVVGFEQQSCHSDYNISL
jgi:hypothetical protein